MEYFPKYKKFVNNKNNYNEIQHLSSFKKDYHNANLKTKAMLEIVKKFPTNHFDDTERYSILKYMESLSMKNKFQRYLSKYIDELNLMNVEKLILEKEYGITPNQLLNFQNKGMKITFKRQTPNTLPSLIIKPAI